MVAFPVHSDSGQSIKMDLPALLFYWKKGMNAINMLHKMLWKKDSDIETTKPTS